MDRAMVIHRPASREGIPMRFANRCAVALAAGSGVLCAVFGALVLAGWHSGAVRLASAFIAGPPTGYLTGASMLLAGIGLAAVPLRRPRLALLGGLFAIAAGVAAILSRLVGAGGSAVASLLQQALPLSSVDRESLGRIAALQLVLFGAALVALGRGASSPRRAPIAASLGAVLLTLGLASSFGHFTGMDATTFWFRLTSVRLQTGIAFAVAGAGLLGAAWGESVAIRPVVPRWFPLVVGAAGATVSIVMWQALSAERPTEFEALIPVPLTILVVGLGFTLLTALAVHWASTARLREREARDAYQQLAINTGQWRLAERAQRRSEERFQLVARATTDAVWSWDVASGDLWWSPGFYALFRYPEAREQRGLDSKTSRLHPADRERVMKSVQEALDGSEDLWSGEYRFRRGDGGYAHVSDRAFILRDPAGRAERIFGSMIDVTARRRAEEERDRFFTLSPDLLCTAGFDGQLKRINPAWTELLGYTEAELLSRPVIDLVHPGDRAATAEAARRIQGSEAVVAFENRYRRRDGTYRWLQWRARRVPEREIFYAFARDVTEEKRIESELAAARDQALQSVNAKSTFLANMSHEIRTPMNGVIGMCELLMDTPLNAAQRRYADTIHSSADSLLTILDDILDFSKSEVGKLTLVSVPFDLRRLTEDILDLFARRAQTKGLELAGLVRRDVPRLLRGDPARLRQVIANLLGNAVKFTERGLVAIEASLAVGGADRAVVRVDVRDTGPGITEGGRQALFASFSQVDPSSTRRHGGTGLGLAICKQLVELMGGTIGVESAPGKGSTFWFTVPFEIAPEPPAEGPDPAPLAGRRVLLVQENPTCRAMLRHVLESWSLEVEEAEDGGSALQRLRPGGADARIDFALVDLYLPDFDGLALRSAIRQLGGGDAAAIVLMTPIGTREEILQKAGFAACLAKPVLATQLLECLIGLVAAPARTDAPPAAETDATAASAAEEPAAVAPEAKPARNLILVVDDNAVNLHVALGQLESHGYVAEVVSNGRDALAALARRRYDLVLMDCQMPGMDGFQATQEIRRREGRSRRTVVVAMTAYALEGDRQKCLAAGMDDYIGKPIRGAELDRVIRRWLRRPTGGAAKRGARDATRLREPEVAGAADAPLVDMTLLADASGHDGARMRDLIGLYSRQMAEQVPLLGAAIAAGAAGEVRRIAHRCAGSSASCGVLGVVPPLRELEHMGKERRLADAPRVFAELEHRLGMVRERLRLHGAATSMS
jgi:PAS domain S-box-containing protein